MAPVRAYVRAAEMAGNAVHPLATYVRSRLASRFSLQALSSQISDRQPADESCRSSGVERKAEEAAITLAHATDTN